MSPITTFIASAGCSIAHRIASGARSSGNSCVTSRSRRSPCRSTNATASPNSSPLQQLTPSTSSSLSTNPNTRSETSWWEKPTIRTRPAETAASMPALIASGAPEAIRAGMEAAVSAGRVLMVGFSHHEVSLRVFGFVDKELDVLGVSCCKGDEFGEAVAFVERQGARLERLVTQEFPLERAPEAMRWAMEHPADAMKVVIGDIN